MRRTAGLVVAGAALAVIAACGSGSGSKPSTAASAGRGSAFAAYTQCLSQNGVKLPSIARPTGLPSNRPSGAPRPSGSPGFGRGGFGGGGFGGGGFGGLYGDENNPPEGVDAATWKAALTACQSKRPTFGGGNQNNGQFAAYRNCLQDHGVTFGQGTNLNTTDPKTAAAMKVCAPLRPTPNRSGQPNG